MSAAPLPEPEALVIETRFGPWRDLPVTTGHATYLSSCGISPAIAKGRVRSIETADQMPEEFTFWRDAVPGMVFTWTTPDTEDSPSRTVLQYKPDDGKSGPEDVRPTDSKGKQRKYWFQGDADGGVLWAVRQLRKAKRALIVEGTKPALVAASHAPADTEVYGIAGCWGLSIGNKIPTPDLEVFEGLDVVLCFDADAASNEDVHAAAIWSQKMLKRYKAKSVKFLTDIGDGKDGLDDVLRMVPEARRGSFLEQAMEDAVLKLPAIRRGRGSAGGSGNNRGGNGGGGDNGGGDNGATGPALFFNQDGLLVDQLATAVRDRYPAALTAEQKVAVYQNGYFDLDGLALKSAVTEFLVDRYRPANESAVENYIVGRLAAERAFLPVYATEPVVNLRNGMLDLRTGDLVPHDPSFLSSQQLPVSWDPDAQCPIYEEWIGAVGLADQILALEELVSTMLDPSSTPQKSVFLFGPSRSGKSTFLRLMQDIAGTGNFSAVALHDLVSDKHMPANLYGKILNIGADLSARHIQDVSIFKMMTGEDPIQANRKYGQQFAFTNRALFAFSANEIPTVGESSGAYLERVRPFEFARSFAGREDPTIETRMRRDELPGILRRWVAAFQRRSERGIWLPIDPEVQEKFESGSDRVRQWVQECCVITTETQGRFVTEGSTVPDKLTMTHKEIVKAFNDWAQAEHGHEMGGKQIKAKLLSIKGVFNVRRATNKAWAINIRIRPEGERDQSPVTLSTTAPTHGGGDGGGFSATGGGSVAVSESKTATDAPTPVSAAEAAAATTGGGQVAEVAVFNPKSATQEVTTGGESVQTLQGVSPSESATSATVPTPVPSDEPFGPTPGGADAVAVFAPETATETATSATGAAEATTGAVAETATSATTFRTVLPAGSTLPEGVVAIDIETASADRLWDAGTGFVRLVGYQCGDQITITSDPAELVEVMRTARLVVGHNIMNFDLVAYARHYGLDLVAMAAEERVFDTFLTSILIDPPRAMGEDEKIALGKIMKERSLDALGAAVLGVAKTGDLDGLAKEFSPTGKKDDGYGAIPVDDARFVEYLRGDVDLTARLAPELRMSKDRRAYVNREHKVAAIAAQIRLNGFRVDVPLLHERFEAGQARKAELIDRLRERYGLPTTKADGKPCAAPQATKEGRASIVQAFTDLGVTLPTTEKGQPSTGKVAMEQVAAEHAGNAAVLELVETIQSLNGIRSVYGTVLDNLHGDRVHPDIRIFQASGRWSTVDPGLTVFGKKGGKHVEREIFLPEPGQVIVAADLAQIDARALAALSQDEAYLAMFAPGLDLHSEVAIRAFKLTPPEEIRHDEKALKVWLGDYRDKAKIVGHGWNYGRGPKPLAIDLVKSGMPFDEALETAVEFDRSMTEAFPRLVEWRTEVRRAGERGELLDNGFGRLMAVHPDRAYTQAPALMGQGCATDHIKQSLLNMAERYPHLLPCIRVSVHDELVFSIPEAEAERYSAEIVDCMTYDWAPSWGERTVFIDAECSKPGANWGAVYAK